MAAERRAGSKTIVVGIVPGQSTTVVISAADLAVSLGAELVCAFVDRARYTVTESLDGSVVAAPFDPDLPELDDETIDAQLEQQIAQTLRDSPVRWSVRALAGDPVRALARLAETLDAELIVVGAREGRRMSIQEFFGGSLAVHLAHRQHRPVVVIPVVPTPRGQQLPWELQ